MATLIDQTDFDFDNEYTFDNLTGGSDGQPRLHTDLSSPLTGNGLYAREFTTTGTAFAVRRGAQVNSSVDGGAFVNVPSTRAISLRAWVRISSADSGVAKEISLNVKQLNGTKVTSAVGARAAGYGIAFGNLIDGRNTNVPPSPGAPNLQLFTGRPNASGGPFDNPDLHTSFPDTVIESGLSFDTWYRIRVDVIPVGGMKDIIRGYRMVGSSWVQMGSDIEILNTDPVYNPWGESRRNGYFFGRENAGSGTSVAWIDSFEIFVADV